jgi:hypothetical protein
MPLAMARPMKRPNTRSEQFVQRIPVDVKAKVRGLKLAIPVGAQTVPLTISQTAPDIRISLRTSDPAEAKARHAAVALYLAGVWQSVRQGPRKLTQKDTVALAGVIYREFVEAIEDDPGKSEMWASVEAANVAAMAGKFGPAALSLHDDETKRLKSMEERFGFLADSQLAKLGFVVDADSRQRLIEQVGRAMSDAAVDLLRNADGDYGPETRTQRFPAWTPPEQQPQPVTPPAASPAVSLLSLLNRLAKERGYAPKTVSEWTRSLQSLTAHAKTEDATAITPEAIIAWMDALVDRG